MLKLFKNTDTLNLFWRYMRQHPRLLALSFLFGPVSALQFIIAPLFVAQGLNQLIKFQHVDVSIILYAAGTLLTAICIGYVLDRDCVARLELKVERTLHRDLFEHISMQDYDFFANNFGGSLVARANRLVKSYAIFHMTLFLEMLPQLCSVLIALGVMTYYSPLMGLSISLLWLCSVIFITVLAIKRMPIRRLAVSKETEQTGELADMVTNAVTVKTFGAEESELARYEITNNSRSNYFFTSWKLAIKNGFIIELLCGTLQILTFVAGIFAVERGIISIAIFLLFQVYILRVVDSLRRASTIVRQFEGILGDSHEMLDQLKIVSQVQDPLHPAPLTVHEGRVDFTDITFKYAENLKNEQAVFDKVSLHIKSGEKIGLVGASGGGKTTLTRLLLRFMDVTSGTIAIDGQDIRTVKQQDLRRAIAYVPQEPLLFHRSIAENIRYGNPSVSDEAMQEAAKLAHAHEFIIGLPQGYDTLVGERGVKLSGGQRQRIAIARTIIKNAPILLLDEATSALDSESEHLIQSALWELMKNRTAIVIAHRLSTIQRMDRIVVLEEGKIIEQGTHKELLSHDGTYAKLWKHQSGGFLDE